MKAHTITTFAALAAACLAGTSAYAGTPVKPGKPVKEVMQESCITGDIGIDVTSNYISKGVVWENQGLILLPYANLHFRVAQNVGPIDSVTVDLGIQSVYTDNRTNALPFGTTGNWLEFNFTAGVTLAIDKLSVSPYFKVYQSPSDVFLNTYTTGVRLAYDDTDLLGDFALHPYALVELQLQGSRGNNFNVFAGPGTFHGRGQYYEVGITPAHSYGDLTLSLPIKGGFGTGGFYLGNRGFGFFSVGIDAEYALNFVPECLGKWSVHSGVTYVRLGGTNTLIPGNLGAGTGAAGLAPAFFSPGTAVANDNNQIVFGGGLKVAF
ncbi:MAG: hypothetical protein ABMA01_01025 [Chthoniobacteraceae bacterium]